MKVLVMGGTGSTASRSCRTCQARSRGDGAQPRRDRGCAAALGRRLYGDRTDHERSPRARKEDFDVVQDISGYTPADVKPLFEVFKGRIGHYIFAGSTVIYAATASCRSARPTRSTARAADRYGKKKLAVERWLFDEYRDDRLPGRPCVVLDGVRPEQHHRRARAAHVHAPAARSPGAHSRRRHDDGPDRPRRRRRDRAAHGDDEPEHLRQALQLTGKDYYTDEGYVDTFAESSA